MNHLSLPVRCCLLIALLTPLTSPGLINPNFSPIDLVKQSQLIVEITFHGLNEDGLLRADVQDTLKGNSDGHRKLVIDQEAAIADAQRNALVEAAGIEGQRGLLFIGAFQPAGMEGEGPDLGGGDGDEGPKAIGFLHLDGLPKEQWLLLENWEGDTWELVQTESFLLATFNGGTDMLGRMVRYIIADPEADVPVNAGMRWVEPPLRVGSVPEDLVSLRALALSGRDSAGPEDLYAAAPSGDHLFRLRDGSWSDVAQDIGLTANSHCSAWGDLNDDGRPDLVSYDGTALVALLQQEDGSFQQDKRAMPAEATANGCLSLQVLSSGDATSLLVGTTALPLLLHWGADGVAMRPLVEDSVAAFPAGRSGCLAADLDGDARVDVLQLGDQSSLLYRGLAPGRFAAPQTVPVRVGDGTHDVVLTDLDQDGLPEIFVAAESQHMLWQLRGDRGFEDILISSGEVSYKFTTEGNLAVSEDFNSDGRLDLVIGYSIPQPPYILYNRGYRSTANALRLNLDSAGRLPQTAEGVLSFCFGNLDEDAAADLAVALHNGELWLLRGELDGEPPLALRATLPAGENGPLNVQASRFGRPLGTRIASAAQPALFRVREPGPVEVSWQYPDGETHTQEILLEELSTPLYLQR